MSRRVWYSAPLGRMWVTLESSRFDGPTSAELKALQRVAAALAEINTARERAAVGDLARPRSHGARVVVAGRRPSSR